MHHLSFIASLFLVSSFVNAEIYTLDPLNIEADSQNSFQTYGEALKNNTFSLQERIENDISFDTVHGDKNRQGLSFRGIDDRATGFYEDGIPLYKNIASETATLFYTPHGDLSINNTAPSHLGVSSMGADVYITSKIPQKSLETSIIGMLSTNDYRLNGYVGSRIDNTYVIASASHYRQNSYELSDNFVPTPAQPSDERRFSDWNQNDVSIKAGYFPDNHSHIAAKISSSRSDFGVPINTHTDITGNAGDDGFQADRVPWDAYTLVPKKDLDSLYLYGDFTHGDVETTVRGYYDRYSDIFAFYNDNSYTTYLGDTLDTYEDGRLGANLKISKKSQNRTDAIAVTVERNTHHWYNTVNESSRYSTQFLETSYIGSYLFQNGLLTEGALSYRLLKPEQKYDSRITFSDYDTKKMLDWQIKLSKSINSWNVYGSAAHKSRFPSMFEMFPLLPFESVNSGLKPEQSFNLEAGTESPIINKTSITIDAFRYGIKDLIVKPSSASQNRDSAIHYGIETRLKSDAFNGHHLSAAYRYAHTKDSAGEAIELIPSHRFVFKEEVDLAPDYTAAVEYLYSGKRYNSYLNQQYTLDPYQTIDLYLSYVKKQGMSYRFGIKNMTDENYEWQYGYPTQGRSAFVSLEWTL